MQWMNDSRSQSLWVHGKAGRGKTMLMISQAQQLQRVSEYQENFGTCSFFCDDKDSHRNNAIQILKSLLSQLGIQYPRSIQYFRNEYDKTSDLFTARSAQQTLWRILEDSLKQLKSHKVFIVIDALDECEANSKEVFLRALNSRLRNEKLDPNAVVEKWLISSRSEDGLSKFYLSSNLVLGLETNLEAVASDVGVFIEAKLRELDTSSYGNDLDVLGRLVRQKSENTFLWVSLAFSEIRHVPPILAMEAIHRLPKGLDDLYRALYQRVLQQSLAEFATAILKCLLVAFNPPTLLEVAVIAGLPDRHSRDEQCISQYLEQCGSFLVVRESRVSFVHQSAKDFLWHTEGLHYSQNLIQEHSRVTKRCLDWLTTFGPNHPDARIYTTFNWPLHAKAVTSDQWRFLGPYKHFLMLETLPARQWAERWTSVNCLGLDPRDEANHTIFCLYLAVKLSILPLAIQIMAWYPRPFREATYAPAATKDLCYPRDRLTSPLDGIEMLEMAANRGDLEIAKLLLDHGVDIRVRDAYGEPILFSAVRGLNPAMIELMIRNEASMNERNEVGRSALLQAIESDCDISIVEKLVSNGADINDADRRGWSILHAASATGKASFVEFLIQRGARVHPIDNENNTPLCVAASRGHTAALYKLLIPAASQYGLDLALLQACKATRMHTAKILLDRGANINGFLNLHAAISSPRTENRTAIVRFLLERGAEVGLEYDPHCQRKSSNALKFAMESRLHCDEETIDLLKGAMAKSLSCGSSSVAGSTSASSLLSVPAKRPILSRQRAEFLPSKEDLPKDSLHPMFQRDPPEKSVFSPIPFSRPKTADYY